MRSCPSRYNIPCIQTITLLSEQHGTEYKWCDACTKWCGRCFFYRCDMCNFDLDIGCAAVWRTSLDDCQQHSFVPILERVSFTCKACGEERKDFAYLCSICRLLVHHRCARVPRIIKIIGHHYSLTLTYSLHQVGEPEHVLCELCYKKVNTKYGVYCCRACSCVAHLHCTDESWLQADETMDSNLELRVSAEESIDFLSHATEEISLDGGKEVIEIKHFSHQHI